MPVQVVTWVELEDEDIIDLCLDPYPAVKAEKQYQEQR